MLPTSNEGLNMGGAKPDATNTSDFLVLDRDAIASIVNIGGLIEIADAALRSTSNGAAVQDIRRVLDLPHSEGACLSIMYAALADRPLFGAKVLSVYPSNFAHGLASHRGGILLFEKEHGRPVALIDGGEATAWRTAAASAVATNALARREASTLTFLGYGEQAQRHVETISAVRPIRKIHVWGRDIEKARRFADTQRNAGFDARAFSDPQEAVAEADIVCTVTSAVKPVLHGAWLRPGTHVNAVGASVPSCQEIDLECVKRACIWVDYLPMALVAAGELIEAIRDHVIDKSDIVGEIGAVLDGKIPGRESDSQITLYRSLGVPAQDIELANFLYRSARASDIGVRVRFKG
jgi:ornithine cyclodeaminase/alanine dehydrogenase-like protein (mu-crystallin family)